MKKFYLLLILYLILPLGAIAETFVGQPIDAAVERNGEIAVLSWKNPKDSSFAETILFRSVIPIADYFTLGAVEGLCDKIYEGQNETYTDTGLAVNLPYYYILFARDMSGNNSDAVVIEKSSTNKQDSVLEPKEEPETAKQDDVIKKTNTLVGLSSNIVNQVSLNEAEMVYNYNGIIDMQSGDESNRLALFIIIKSPHNMNEQEKRAISYFIHAGTPTTILLGTGERAGVLNSYLSAFDKLPRNLTEWQDVIKIANGRWPEERSTESEYQASNLYFQTIYERKPNMKSEKNAIKIYQSIFEKDPIEALDWDLVRAIAYSGATR